MTATQQILPFPRWFASGGRMPFRHRKSRCCNAKLYLHWLNIWDGKTHHMERWEVCGECGVRRDSD